jgi:hypothetical protein
MDRLLIISNFFKAISNDPRIGVSHISLFCALVQCESLPGTSDLIPIKSGEIMNIAKISGLATYHRCIRDLDSYGYIIYRPSYNHRKKSSVFISANKIQ